MPKLFEDEKIPESETKPITKGTRYQILAKVLGEGTYSTVHLAKDLVTDEMIAVKIIDLRKYPDEFIREVEIMQRFDHLNIVRFLGSEQTPFGQGYIFMQYLSSPTLHDVVTARGRGLSEERAFQLLYQLASAVDSMHSQGVSHHDIKPENISIDDELGAVIFDFGLSLVVPNLQDPLVNNYWGSPLYMAPEVLMRQPHDPFKADVWSLGIVLYFMLVGDTPWYDVSSLDELMDLVFFEDELTLPSSLSQKAKTILSGMLAREAKDRMSLQQVMDLL